MPPNAFAVTYLGPFVSSVQANEYPKAGILNHPTDVAVDPDGDIYVTDWGNHRVSIFDSEGNPITNLMGDAQVMSKWGQQSIDANPDMMKARRRVRNRPARQGHNPTPLLRGSDTLIYTNFKSSRGADHVQRSIHRRRATRVH